MRHLAYVQGLLISVSGASHLLRAELPDAHSYFPPGYVSTIFIYSFPSPHPTSISLYYSNTLMALQRFNATTLARFIKFERPDNAEDVSSLLFPLAFLPSLFSTFFCFFSYMLYRWISTTKTYAQPWAPSFSCYLTMMSVMLRSGCPMTIPLGPPPSMLSTPLPYALTRLSLPYSSPPHSTNLQNANNNTDHS